MAARTAKKTALFVTCLVDQFFPQVGEAATLLLERCGREVDVPLQQTCCAQPAFNSGYRDEARQLLGVRFIEKSATFREQVSKLCDIPFEHLGGRRIKETAGHGRIAVSAGCS
jgi:hypothetical protein